MDWREGNIFFCFFARLSSHCTFLKCILQSAKTAMFAHQPLGNFSQSTADAFKGVSAHQNQTPSPLRHPKTYNLNHIAQRILPPNPQPPLPLILPPPRRPPYPPRTPGWRVERGCNTRRSSSSFFFTCIAPAAADGAAPCLSRVAGSYLSTLALNN